MNETEATSVAQAYAAKWNVPWGETLEVVSHRTGIWPVRYTWAYSIKFEGDRGPGEIHLYALNANHPIDRLVFWPTGPADFLLPPWAAFPNQSRISSLWRQGHGEVYMKRWREWFQSLADDRKTEYERQYPPPSDIELCFEDFYDDRRNDA